MAARHDMALLDLDGVVYLVGNPIPGAPETIDWLRGSGVLPRFVTNNASRRPGEVAELLTSRGVTADESEVCTSAQAAAEILRSRCAPGDAVLVVGSDALAAEVAEMGLTPIREPSGEVRAVVQGYGPQVGWKQLADAAVEVRGGILWVATNTDATMPSPRGPLPGNGTMIAAVATAAGRQPDAVAGKPEPALLERATAGHHDPRPIVVGDRWDTDIAAAVAAGMPGMLVLSGTTTPPEVLDIPPYARPDHLAWSIAGLQDEHPRVEQTGDTVECREWTVRGDGERLTLFGSGDALDALRALAQAAWRDAGHQAVAGDKNARDALAHLGFGV